MGNRGPVRREGNAGVGRRREHEAGDDPDHARRVLQERARRLAEPQPSVQSSGSLEAVTIRLGAETYALEAAYVHGVFRLTEVAALPGAEASSFGVTTWQGDLLRVIDLRRLLGLDASGIYELNYGLVLGRARAEVGIPADAIAGLTAIPIASIGQPTEGTSPRPAYVRGVTREAIIILDAPGILRLQD